MVLLEDNRPRATTLTCLRLYNVTQEENETPEDCFHKIKEIIKEAALDIPDLVIDRAHRVGAGYNNKPPAMIVKFTTSRHRTKLYRARKEIKEKFGYSLQVDLAKENLYTLKRVREIGREHRETTGFEFAYANVNCILFMKINGRFERFTTVEEAGQLMGLDPELCTDPETESGSSDSQETIVGGYSSSGDSDGPQHVGPATVGEAGMLTRSSSSTTTNDEEDEDDDDDYDEDEDSLREEVNDDEEEEGDGAEDEELAPIETESKGEEFNEEDEEEEEDENTDSQNDYLDDSLEGDCSGIADEYGVCDDGEKENTPSNGNEKLQSQFEILDISTQIIGKTHTKECETVRNY